MGYLKKTNASLVLGDFFRSVAGDATLIHDAAQGLAVLSRRQKLGFEQRKRGEICEMW